MKKYFISTKIDGFNCFIENLIETEKNYYLVFKNNRYRDDTVIKFFLRNMQDVEKFDMLIMDKILTLSKNSATIEEVKNETIS